MRTILLIAVLAGCATTGDRFRQIDPGMTTADVVGMLGRPDGVQVVDEFTVYTYANRTMSWQDWRDKANYHVVFREDRVVQYGPGEIRRSGATIVIDPPPS